MAQLAAENPVWFSEGLEKRRKVRDLFSEIAPAYDRMNGLMCASLHHRWRGIAVQSLALQPGSRVLDACCGTGDFVRPLRRAVGASGSIVGIDFSPPMLAIACRKYPSPTSFALGDATAIPLASKSVDAVTVGWGVRNIHDIDQAHREVARVLKPGGRFVSVDMAQPPNVIVRAVSKLVLRSVIPLIGGLFGRAAAYAYLPESTQRFRSRKELAESMESAGLVDVRYRDFMLGNICMHFGRKS